MGSGFTNNPPDEGTPLPPAADVDAESFLSEDAIGSAFTAVTAKILQNPLVQEGINKARTEGQGALIAWLQKNIGTLLTDLIKDLDTVLTPLATAIVQLLTPAIAGLSDIFGVLSGAYTEEVTRHYATVAGGGVRFAGTGAGNAAKYAFDNIVAPIATFTSGADPSQPGAGEKNIQQTLGVLVQLHLITWVLNVISNISGVGQLKFFNSFTEVLTTAMGARGLARNAMKPYVSKFITEPAVNDLNTAWPIADPSAASVLKMFIRGAIDQPEMVRKLKKLGYAEEAATQLYLDAVRMMGVDDVAYLVKKEVWTLEQGEKYLNQLGYGDSEAKVVLFRQMNAVVYDNRARMADKLGGYFADKKLDDQQYFDILTAWGFSHEEAQSYVHLYALDLDFPKELTYSQVESLYKEDLVDLDYVRQYLIRHNNSPEDADLLILLDFAKKDQRDATRNVLAAQARVTALQKTAAAAVATTKQDTALAQALAQLAAAKAALAASYGQ